MKKNERITAFVQACGLDRAGGLDAHYAGYFTCFNAGDYYEAHDVLEHLWLRGCGEEHAFYKGLIQIAGAFVHLRKQYLRPEHPKDGRRLRPAVRLFGLGVSNRAVRAAAPGAGRGGSARTAGRRRRKSRARVHAQSVAAGAAAAAHPRRSL